MSLVRCCEEARCCSGARSSCCCDHRNRHQLHNRDIFSGLVVLPFLLKADRRTTATLFAISIVVLFGDGLVILRHLGFAPPIYIHWGTALYMMIVAAFLLRKQNTIEGPS
jgi:hypothetical protein